MLPAPPIDRLPAYPACWYLFGRLRDLRGGLLSRDLLGRRLVAVRTSSGRLAVLEARCSPLGADLGRGRVVGEAVQCPFHNWEYGLDGRCRRIPNSSHIPSFAHQASYPVQERHGLLFVFNGREPLFPLPFFDGEKPEDFVAGTPYRFRAECAWYMLAANGFDAEHFLAVHDRTFLGPPVVDCPAPFARRMRYTAQVTGHSVYDLLLRRFVGDRVEVSITAWAGPHLLVTGRFRRAHSRLLITGHPLPDGRSLVDVIVFARRSRNPLVRATLAPLGLWLRRLFTRGFLQDDLTRLSGIRYNPASLIETDRELIEYFRWVAALPQGPGRDNQRQDPGPLLHDNGLPCKELAP
jgi:nitrite reductase/ring-hydroxylating ferredoxin subunit